MEATDWVCEARFRPGCWGRSGGPGPGQKYNSSWGWAQVSQRSQVCTHVHVCARMCVCVEERELQSHCFQRETKEFYQTTTREEKTTLFFFFSLV